MLFSAFSLFACSGYEFNEGDFVLTVEVNKTEVRIGDTVEFSVRLENVSGRDIRVQHVFFGRFDREDILFGVLCYEKFGEISGYAIGGPACVIIDLNMFRRRRRMMIEKNEIIKSNKSIRIDEERFCLNNECESKYINAFTVAMFYIDGEFIMLASEPMRINLIREND